jgi:hypothetical protein
VNSPLSVCARRPVVNISQDNNTLYVYVGVGAPLQTTVENRTGSTSCVGDIVTYTCTAGGSAHTWRIAPLVVNDIPVTINTGNPTFLSPDGARSPFMITTASVVDNNITTELTVTSFAGLNGGFISCRDSSVVNGELQETNATVFGECSPGS